MNRARRSLATTVAVGAAAAAAIASVASGAPAAPGYNTTQAAMVAFGAGAPVGSTADAIISVGDTLSNGYRFESIPDGVAFMPRGQGRVDVYVNHETSTVPFPFSSPWPQASGVESNQNDYDNSQLSKLQMSPHGNILHGSMAISTVENFQRFCSSFLATAVEGFSRPILFMNEEATDWVFRKHTAWPGPTFQTPGTAGAEQAGAVVAYDPLNGKRKAIYGMGRHNHENTVAIPGFKQLVMLSGDDTFSTNPASSQVYMYMANTAHDVWNDTGTLYALSAVDTTKNDYFDIQPGQTVDVEFVPVPKSVATGKNAQGHDLLAGDFGYPAPPGGINDGPQWILDQWGNKSNTPSLSNDVFDFIRIEDVAYDRRPGMSNVVYLADSGRATAGAANPLTTSSNGRVWRLELTPHHPTLGKLSVLVQGDDNPVASTDAALSFNEIHQPDNLETTPAGSLLVTEDPSSANQYSLPRGANETNARLWRVDLNAGNPDAARSVLLEADQALDENATGALGAVDVDAAAAGRLGAWETSGIIDASSAFGAGAFLLTIQAHSYWVEKAAGPDMLNNPNGPDYYYKREGGQLILLRMPGV